MTKISGEKLIEDFKKLPFKLQELAIIEVERMYLNRKQYNKEMKR